MLNYSIHTYELYAKTTYEEYSEINRKLFNLKVSCREDCSTPQSQAGIKRISRIYSKLKIPGINSIELFRVHHIPYYADIEYGTVLKYGIRIIINPYNALHEMLNSDSNIVDASEISIAVQKIDKYLLNFLGPDLHSKLKLRRCDFCVNLPFQDQELANQYIKIVSKGVTPCVLKEHLENNVIQHRKTPIYDSFWLECASYSFEIYNKYTQMIERHLMTPSSAIGTVRIELRAQNSKIKTLEKTYFRKKPTYIEFLIYAPSIAEIEISLLMHKMLGSGNFYTQKYTLSKIDKAKFSNQKKCLMKAIVIYSAKRKRCHTLLKDFNLTHAQWKALLANFDKIGCSPFTISSRLPISELPGINSWDSYF